MEIITAWGAYPNIEELARHMNMSVNTVQTHLKRMRKKLKVRKTVEVWLWTQKALDEGKM